MNIVQTFCGNMASQYDKLFADRQATAELRWHLAEETGFYQPIVTAVRQDRAPDGPGAE